MRYIKGDALEEMDKLIENGITFHAIKTDLPFGTTACKWDDIIPFKPMWERVNKLLKPNGVVIFNAAQPFTSALIMSNPKMFKYTWVYQKTTPTGALNAKIQPMRAHEDVVVFYKKQCTYNPQITTGHKRKVSSVESKVNCVKTKVYGKHGASSYDSTERYPLSVQVFSTDKQKSSLHSTQKPVALDVYLLKTYTNDGDYVLDFTCGSGTTAVACDLTGRICISIDSGDYDGKERWLFGLSWVNIARLRVEGILK